MEMIPIISRFYIAGQVARYPRSTVNLQVDINGNPQSERLPDVFRQFGLDSIKFAV